MRTFEKTYYHINLKLFVCLLDLWFRSRFLWAFYMFGSVRFRFGKQNFHWLVLFGSGRTVKHCFGWSLIWSYVSYIVWPKPIQSWNSISFVHIKRALQFQSYLQIIYRHRKGILNVQMQCKLKLTPLCLRSAIIFHWFDHALQIVCQCHRMKVSIFQWIMRCVHL